MHENAHTYIHTWIDVGPHTYNVGPLASMLHGSVPPGWMPCPPAAAPSELALDEVHDVAAVLQGGRLLPVCA